MERTIITKFKSECRNCKNNIKEGTEVYWTKGKGVKCITDCPKRYKNAPSHRWTSIRRGKAS